MNRQGFVTDRLIVRFLHIDDYEVCCQAQREAALPYHQQEGEVLTLSQLEPEAFAIMLARRARWAGADERYVLSAFLRAGGCFVGDAMLFDVSRTPYARAEIGAVVAPSRQGRGLGSELISGVVAWGLNELCLAEITGFIEEENPRSTAACLRAGFSLLSSSPVSRMFQGKECWGWPIVVRATG